MKKIFYFNINYFCNNKCVFCYSHNTIENSEKNELSLKELKTFIDSNNIHQYDRIIINGGEPLLHSEINEILSYLSLLNVEVLIFSNGRNIKNLNPLFLNKNIRFIIPIHGDKIIHDSITTIDGSFYETISSLEWLKNSKSDCLVDLKIILNNKTIIKENFLRSLKTWKSINFNNALHLTMMADTKISNLNGCASLPLDKVSHYTLELFKAFKSSKKIKIYGTCLQAFNFLQKSSILKYNDNFKIIYKDFIVERSINLKSNNSNCDCNLKHICFSEIHQYKVLEYFKNNFYENME